MEVVKIEINVCCSATCKKVAFLLETNVKYGSRPPANMRLEMRIEMTVARTSKAEIKHFVRDYKYRAAFHSENNR